MSLIRRSRKSKRWKKEKEQKERNLNQTEERSRKMMIDHFFFKKKSIKKFEASLKQVFFNFSARRAKVPERFQPELVLWWQESNIDKWFFFRISKKCLVFLEFSEKSLSGKWGVASGVATQIWGSGYGGQNKMSVSNHPVCIEAGSIKYKVASAWSVTSRAPRKKS